MSKQDPYRFNLRFDDTDKDHRKVCDFLNTCGRKKPRYIVKAFLAYWGMQEKEEPEKQEEGKAVQGKEVEEHLVTVGAENYSADEAEISLMRKNYQMFAALGEEEAL